MYNAQANDVFFDAPWLTFIKTKIRRQNVLTPSSIFWVSASLDASVSRLHLIILILHSFAL